MRFSDISKLVGRHSGLMLAVIFVIILLTASYGLGVFQNLSRGNEAFLPNNSESRYVRNETGKLFANNQPDILVLLKSKDASDVTTPENRREIEQVQQQLQRSGATVQSYTTTGQDSFISTDKTQTFFAVAAEGDLNQSGELVERLRDQLKNDRFDIKIGGIAAINHDVNNQVERDLVHAETISFLILAPLLVLVFRSAIAALLPLLLGALGIVIAFILTRLITEFMGVSQYAINVITLLGLGLAIDYSLLIVSRFREELRMAEVDRALKRTLETAGRTVLFSGLTVVLSLMGMMVFPVDFLRSMAIGGSAAVLASLFAALIILPALLQLLGRRVNWLAFGSARRDQKAQQQHVLIEERQSIWYKTGSRIMRHNKTALLVTAGFLIAVGLPFLRIHFATPDYRSLPEGSEARLVSETLARNFNDQGESLTILYETHNSAVLSSNEIGKLYDYAHRISQIQGVADVESVVTLDKNIPKTQYQQLLSHSIDDPKLAQLVKSRTAEHATVLNVHYRTSSDSRAAQDLVERVRAVAVPADVSVHVGGSAAELHDLISTLRHYVPYGLALVMAAIFVLLFLMLGSVLLPLQAIVMNVLALGAAFGSLVWIFQEGHLNNLLSVAHTGSIDATMPILIFAVAFGLSMDYSVFLYGRIKEQYEANGHDNDKAVLAGLQKVGSIITSAAILLFVVVAAFAAGNIPLIQQVGLGLALTVLIDAFIIRMVLVPASMKLLGKWNWWAPEPLKRLHRRFGVGH